MYIDFIIKLKNAQAAGKTFLKIPYTKMDRAVANLLEKKGFLKKVEVKGRTPKKIIKTYLNSNHPIKGVQLISKPSRRIYKKYKELRSVKSGYGTLIVSTPEGILPGEEAQKMKVGGQLLFKIW